MSVPLSVVTVCMNRHSHLLVSAAAVARWPHHQEHLILDWSSDQPLQRGDLPQDPRIRLVRVDGERQWHLCRAYNLAIQLAIGERLLKLDADCWPEAMPAPGSLAVASEGPLAAFCSGPDGRAGQWLLDRSLVDQVGGFNEVLVGYGFDDKDFRARVEAQGVVVQLLPATALGVISHSANLRVSTGGPETPLTRVSAHSLKRATAIANRVLAAGHPWSVRRQGSVYDRDPATGVLRVQRPSIPRPSLQVDDEAQRLRRRIYWGLLFSIPEELVLRLPVRLLPSDIRGRFPLNRLHSWGWYLLRPFWAWPLLLLQGIQRPSQAARAEQMVWEALDTHDWQALITALSRLRRQMRRGLIERLLFQRGLRPHNPLDQQGLFEALLESTVLDADQRAYAGVALGWTLIRLDAIDSASSLIRTLQREADRLAVDPAASGCQRRNRENRLKRLVSIWTVLIQLMLLAGKEEGIPAVAMDAHRLLVGTDLMRIPADVVLRMSSNWVRCLVWNWPVSPEVLLDDLMLLQKALNDERCAESHPDEDHRAFLDTVLQRLQRGEGPADALEESLNHSSTTLIAAVRRFALSSESARASGPAGT